MDILQALNPNLAQATPQTGAATAASDVAVEGAVPGEFSNLLMQQLGAAKDLGKTIAPQVKAETVSNMPLELAINPDQIINLDQKSALVNLSETETVPAEIIDTSMLEAKLDDVNIEETALSDEEFLKQNLLNSNLVNPQSELPINDLSPRPKVFDQNLSKQVEDVLNPTEVRVNPEQLQLQNVQKASVESQLNVNSTTTANTNLQELLATGEQTANPEMLESLPIEGKNTGRSPAIDFDKAEVDSKLLNFDDFVSQKNAVTKKIMPQQVYGTPQKNALINSNKLVAKEAATKDIALPEHRSLTVNDLTSHLSSNPVTMNKTENSIDVNVSQNQKVFNMSDMKTSNPQEIITQITDYIAQVKTAKEPTVNMKVQHDQLGMIDITVQRTQNEAMAISIGTHTQEGKAFFNHNQSDLLSSLSHAGLNVSEFKLENSSNNKSFDQSSSQQFAQGERSGQGQFGSQQNQKQSDSDRRQELWNLLKEKEVA